MHRACRGSYTFRSWFRKWVGRLPQLTTLVAPVTFRLYVGGCRNENKSRVWPRYSLLTHISPSSGPGLCCLYVGTLRPFYCTLFQVVPSRDPLSGCSYCRTHSRSHLPSSVLRSCLPNCPSAVNRTFLPRSQGRALPRPNLLVALSHLTAQVVPSHLISLIAPSYSTSVSRTFSRDCWITPSFYHPSDRSFPHKGRRGSRLSLGSP